ncbi:MAG: hypothetical protein IRZ07_28890 [Microbispora sp.]|nr:hypothetical protein [Microbispora sp.]
MITAIVAPAILPVAGPAGFFTDPLNLPPQALEVPDRRASAGSVFIGAAGLVVAVVALLLRMRAGTGQATSQPVTVPAAPGVPRTPPAGSPAQNAAPGGGRRTHGGDHIEFHHSTFSGTVIGKQVSGPQPPTPPASADGDGDDRVDGTGHGRA